MSKRFHFDSPQEHYQADAVVLWCFDDRFTLAVQKFFKRIGVARADSVRLAGGPMALASPKSVFERDFVLEQLRLSRKLHQTDRVLLIAHRDCGAYGGSQRFADPNSEASFQSGELAKATDVVRAALPEASVECYFADFDGVWEMEPAQSANSVDLGA